MPDNLAVLVELTDNITKSDFEMGVEIADLVIAQTRETGDPYVALEFLRKVERIKNLTAIAKAKILHFLSAFWVENRIDAPFFQSVQAFIGIYNETVLRRYISIWDMFETGKIPKRIQEELRSRPLRDLIPIMGAVNQGYAFTDDNWDKIVDARDYMEIAQIVREDVKDVEPRAHVIHYSLGKDGSLYAINQGQRYLIGRFMLSVTDAVAKNAIMRAIDKLNVFLPEEDNE